MAPLTVVIDQLDEHPNLEGFVRQLRAALNGKDTRSLHLLIACRAAEYPESLTALLKQSFGSCTVAELAPLTWDQAADIVAEHVPDPDEFLEAIIRSGSGSLASSPLTLGMLTGSGVLSDGGGWPALRIFRHKVRVLLDSSREPAHQLRESSLEERFAIASRIAAYLLLSGRRTLWIRRGAWSHGEVITPGLLASGREAAGLGDFEVTPIKIDDTLATQMFAAGAESTEFIHSSVAAFLAAKYLVDRFRSSPSDLAERQLSGVFLVSAPDEPTARIPEHLRETAAWMLGLAPHRSKWLATADPHSLAAYWPWIPDHEVRSILVEGLLDRAERIELSGGAEWPPVRWDLTNPGLAQRLSQIIGHAAAATEYTWNDLARIRLAIRLAHDARVPGAVDALLELAQAQVWPVAVRQRAAKGAMNCSPSAAIPRLQELLRRLVVTDEPVEVAEGTPDFDDLSGDSELVGTLLSLLWPEHLDFEDAVVHIRPRRHRLGVGVYLLEAPRFASNVRDDDLDRLIAYATSAIRGFLPDSDASHQAATTDTAPVATAEFLDISDEYERGLQGFLAPICERVMSSRRAYELLPATARLIAPLLRASIAIPLPIQLELADPAGNELTDTKKLRRMLAHELLVNLTAADKPLDRYTVYLVVSQWRHQSRFGLNAVPLPPDTQQNDRQRLLDDGDTAWCLSQIDMAQTEGNVLLTQAYSLMASIIADPLNPHTFDLLEHRPNSPEREHFRWVFDGMPINDPLAQAMRRNAGRRASSFGSDGFAATQQKRLEDAMNGASEAFWVLVHDLWANPVNGRFENARSTDILASPGVSLWSAGDFSKRFRSAAGRYLDSEHDHRQTWLGTEKFDHRAAAGLTALAFIRRTEGMAGLRSLPTTVWASWIAAILCGSPGLADEETQLITDLLVLVTEFGLGSLGDTIDQWARVSVGNGIAPWHLEWVVPLLPRAIHPRMITLAIELSATAISRTAAPSTSASSGGCSDRDRVGEDGNNLIPEASGRADIARRIWSALLEPALKLGDQQAVDHVEAIFSASQPPTAGESLEMATAAAVLLLTTDAEGRWPVVAAAMTESTDFARHLAYACTAHKVSTALTEKLSDTGIVECYRWLAQIHPPETEVVSAGVSNVTPAQEIHSLRRAIIAAATRRGTPDVVRELRNLLKDNPDSLELRSALVNARTLAQAKAAVHLSTRNIRDLLADPRRRAVNSDAQLATVVAETLAEIESDIHTHGYLLWDCERDPDENQPNYRFRPKPEGSFAAYIAHQLKLRLAERSVVINREVVIQPTNPRDAGQRPDILVSAVPAQPTLDTAVITVPIEIKGSWHKGLLTAQEGQLLPYLPMAKSVAGIYLAAWFPLQQWTALRDEEKKGKASRHRSAEHLLKVLQEQASQINHDTGMHVTAYVFTVSTTEPSEILYPPSELS